jgi:hypothetical protein
MKSPFTSLSVCAGVLALATTAQAGISFSSSGNLSSWDGTPTYVSIPSASLGAATVAQGDATITGSYGVMAELFTPTSTFTLGSFSLICGINVATTYEVHLYHLGPAGTIAPNASASYTPGTDLFSGLSIALSTSGGTVQGNFALSGADQVSLLANEQYALEIWTPAAAGAAGITWFRLPSNTPLDPGGQMFTAGDAAGIRQTLNLNGQAGGAPRTAALALHAVVPEPSSLALIGLGALSCLIRRRK